MDGKRFVLAVALGCALLAAALGPAAGTEENVRTLLPAKAMDAVIAHASGDIAFQHLRRIGLFNRLAASEAYHEAAEYVLGQVEKYGLSETAIEKFPADGKAWYAMFQSFHGWDGRSGTVWLTSPHREKICDFAEMPATLCRWSNSAHVAGELIDVGAGGRADFEGKDVKGKVVLTTSDPGSVHREAVFNRGALGVISSDSPRGLDYPDVVMRSGIRPYETADGRKSTFGFKISHRQGLELSELLKTGAAVTVQVDVEARVFESDFEDVVAVIPGADPAAGEFLVTAHLCHFDPGSNDNASGAASILEIARAIQELIATGEIPRPRRSIRFIWVPEMSGSHAYATTYPDKTDRMLCGLNLDMVGSYLNRNNASFLFHMTPDSLPHYINDVVGNFADFVGRTNTEDDYYTRYRFSKPILSGQGSRDSFRYKILPYMGGSDHRIYNDRLVNVPMVFFNTWPDPYYESSHDTPDRVDQTTLRREVVVAVASAVYVAGAGAPEALTLASEVYARGLARIGRDVKKAFEALNAEGAGPLAADHKEADNIVRRAFIREKGAIDSVLELAPNDAALAGRLTELRARLDSQLKDAVKSVEGQYQAVCRQRGLRPEPFGLDAEDLAARKLVPVRNEKLRGPLGAGYVAERAGANPLAGLSPQLRDERALYEMFNFIDGKNSVLDIRNAVSAEYAPVPLPEVRRFMEILAKAGVIRLDAAASK